MGYDLAFDYSSSNGLVVNLTCGLKSLIVAWIFHIYLFGILERACCKSSGRTVDALLCWREMEIDRHDSRAGCQVVRWCYLVRDSIYMVVRNKCDV